MFAVEGFAAVLLGFAVLFFLTDHPDRARWLSADEREALVSAHLSERPAHHAHSFLSALRSATTIRLAIVFLLLTFPMFAITFFVPLVTAALVGAENGSAVDVVTFIPFALGAIASVAWSYLARRQGLRNRYLAAPTVLAGAGVALCAVAGASFPLLVVGVAFSAVGIYAAVPVFWSIASASLAGAAAASGLALVNTAGSLGGFAAGYVTGWLPDLTGGYTVPFCVMAISLVASGVLAGTTLRQRSTRESEHRETNGAASEVSR
jgi:ACS family tartrate transporter-like MFS transporter